MTKLESQVSLEGSTFDTTLGVYLGKAVGALTLVTSNADAPYTGRLWSRVTFTTAPGLEYFIQVRAWGSFLSLRVTCATLSCHFKLCVIMCDAQLGWRVLYAQTSPSVRCATVKRRLCDSFLAPGPSVRSLWRYPGAGRWLQRCPGSCGDGGDDD